MFAGSNPGFTEVSDRKLRRSSPAPIVNVTAIATSATTSAARARWRNAPPTVPRLFSCSAERHACGELLLTRDASREHEVRHVHGGDDEHEADAGQQYEERSADRTDRLFEHGHHGCAPPKISVRVGLFHLPRRDRHVSLHL